MSRLAVLLSVLALLPSGSRASDPKNVDWLPAILVSFTTVSKGQSCRQTTTTVYSTTNGSAPPTQQPSGEECSDVKVKNYLLRVGQNLFTLAPVVTGKQTARDGAITVGTLGWGALFLRHRDVLARELPGAQVLIAASGKSYLVKVGGKISTFELIAAQ